MEEHRRSLKQHRINTAIFAILGAVIGYVSFLINIPLVSLVLAAAVFAVAGFAVKKRFKIEKKKWWTSPLAVYVFTWLVVWAIFFNVYIVQGFY